MKTHVFYDSKWKLNDREQNMGKYGWKHIGKNNNKRKYLSSCLIPNDETNCASYLMWLGNVVLLYSIHTTDY